MHHGLRAVCALLLVWSSGAWAAADLTLLAHQPAKAAEHPPLILLLHGSGADERDMITMWPDLPQEFVVIALRAPFRDGGGGYRWYRADHRETDIAVSRKIIDRVAETCLARFAADPNRVFVAGFSQGAVMAYEATLHEPRRFRGAAALSGTLLASATSTLPPRDDLARTAVFIGHGAADTRSPVSSATRAHAELDRLGIANTVHVYPGLGHGTSGTEVADLRAWLAARLPSAK
jgi:phospholipase/carboxylesterase